MSRRPAEAAETKLASVSFTPLPGAEGERPVVDFAGVAPVDSLLGALRQPLLELARRTRRLGPADTGAMLLLAGCGRGVGTSMLALALAGAAAAEMPVMLIDGDLGHPGLSEMLDQPAELGWEDAVRGLCDFDRPVQYADSNGRIAFLPLQRAVSDPGELMCKPALRVWLPQLRQDYGLIIVDGGSVFNTGSKWAPWVDVSMLACDARKKHVQDWAPAWDALEKGESHVLGILETFASSTEAEPPRKRSNRIRSR